jgi:hypothetical protein
MEAVVQAGVPVHSTRVEMTELVAQGAASSYDMLVAATLRWMDLCACMVRRAALVTRRSGC